MEYEQPKIKPFSCSIHSKETICRINKQPNASHIGFCVECIMELDEAQRNSLLSIENVIENAVMDEVAQLDIRIDSPPPSQYTDILAAELDLISKLSDHISSQKEQVSQRFKVIQDEVQMQIERARDRTLNTLDAHFISFKDNYREFKKRVQRHYKSDHSDDQKDQISILNEILSQIKNLKSTQEFESKMQNLLTSSSLNLQQQQDAEAKVMMIVDHFKEKLGDAYENPPIANGFLEKGFEQNFKSITEAIQQISYLAFNGSIQEQDEFPLKFNSEIVAPCDATKVYKIIENVIGPHSSYQSEKIYECANLSNWPLLYKAWHFNPDVLMIIKCQDDQTLGAFRHPNMPKTNSTTFYYQKGSQISFHLDKKSSVPEQQRIEVDGYSKEPKGPYFNLSQFMVLSTISNSFHQFGESGKLGGNQVYHFAVEKIEIHTIRWENWVEEIYQESKGSGKGGLFGNSFS